MDQRASASSTASPETRDRLLEAAGEVFAKHGFHRATVRDICSRAGANVAAVNYHFGDKQGLYAAVLRHFVIGAVRKYPPDLDVPPNATAEVRLHGFIRAFLYRILEGGPAAVHGRLMLREMIEPTAALDLMFEEAVRPMAGGLFAIVRELLGPGANPETIHRAAVSIVGQCCFYRHAAPMLQKLKPDEVHDRATIEKIADHITRFSLRGIAGCGGKEGTGPQ